MLLRGDLARVSCVASMTISVLCSLALGQDERAVEKKVRTAWDKFNEMLEVSASHGARGELAIRQIELGRYQSDLNEKIGEMRAEVDRWRTHPNRFNSYQVSYFEELQGYRQELARTNRALDELGLRWRQLNQEEIRAAEIKGKRVKPLDQVGLLHLLQSSADGMYGAFREARDAIAEEGSGSAAHTRALRSAVDRLKAGGAGATLGPPDDFIRAFVQYCGGSRFFETRKLPVRSRRPTRSTGRPGSRPKAPKPGVANMPQDGDQVP